MQIIHFDHTHPQYADLLEIFLNWPQKIPHDFDLLPPLKITGQAVSNRMHSMHFLLAEDQHKWVGRASFSTHGPRPKIGLIGHFQTLNSAGEGPGLLQAVEEILYAQGVREIHGPIEGTIFQKYRFMLTGHHLPAFLGEPRNAPHEIDCFLQANYQLAQQWQSWDLSRYQVEQLKLAADALITQKEVLNPEEKLLKVVPLDFTDFPATAREIYPLALEIFKNNYGFTPLSFAEFFENFSSLNLLLAPGGLLGALNEKNEMVGFIYGYPNYSESFKVLQGDPHQLGLLQQARPQSFVAHTMGILPSYRGSTLPYKLAQSLWSHYLQSPFHYQECIAALVIEGKSFFQKMKPPTRTYGIFKKIFT